MWSNTSGRPSKEDYLENKRKTLEAQARQHIGRCNAVIALLTVEPDLAIMVKVDTIKIGLCSNDIFVELLRNEIAEAEKCLAGQENKFE